MIYVIYCQLSPDCKIKPLEKTIRQAAPFRKMTDSLWLIDTDSVPRNIETVLKSYPVKSFVAPLHPNGPKGGNLLPADKEKRKILYIIHCQFLREPEKEVLEKLIEESGPSRKLTDDFWLIKADLMPERIENFLRSLNVIFFAAPLHPTAQCGGNFLAADAEWMALFG